MARSEHGGEPAAPVAPAAVELPSDGQVRAAVTAFAMLAEPTRLRLLWLVSAEELDVSSLANQAARLLTRIRRTRLVGVVTGASEALVLVFRLFTGPLSDRTRRHWPISIAWLAGAAIIGVLYDTSRADLHLFVVIIQAAALLAFVPLALGDHTRPRPA